MVLQTHLQCQIISITPATKYKHHSTTILIETVISAWCTTTAWFFNWMTLFLMCKMIIHYRTYLQNGITNTFVTPNNFYITSNQIQTPFNCYFDTYSDKCIMYYSMVFKLNDTVPDVQDDHPLQNISSECYYKRTCNAK